MARMPFNFLSFDKEPKRSRYGPPPAYRSVSGSVTETDTWSDYSASSGLGKRRASWTNLVESDENLNKYKLNCYPKVKQMVHAAQQLSSRASSQLAFVSDNYQFNLMNSSQPMPLKMAPPVPAGTLLPVSTTQSRTSSIGMAAPASQAGGSQPDFKRNRLQQWKTACSRPCCYICLLLVVLAIIAGVISAIVLTQVLKPPKTAQMSWLAPEMFRGGQNTPVRIEMKAKNDQVRLQMQGAMPFKGNYISYYDFKTNRVGVIDETLKGNGKSSTCFLLPLDRSNLHDVETMRYAAGNAAHRSSQTQGWGESWQYLPSPLPIGAQEMFNPPIPECDSARWIQLEYVGSNQKNRKCSDCYDFCLPDYGIGRDSVRGEEYLNIIKRICFYLFVPEWRTYAQANSIEQNQRDFETYYRNRNHLTTAYGSNGGGDSKWITLQQLPQTIQNVTGNLAEHLNSAASNVLTGAGGIAQGARAGVFGRNTNIEPQQHTYHNGNANPNAYNGLMQTNLNGNPSNPIGFAPATVNGVMNMNGVNGQNSNTAYSMNGDTLTNYGNSPTNGFASKNPYSLDRSNQPQGNAVGYSQNGIAQEYIGKYGAQNQANDYPINSNPYITSDFGMMQGYNNRPAVNVENPPSSAHVPHTEHSIQGVAGMHLPLEAIGSHTGYRPDIIPNPQYQQQQQQMTQQRWG